MKLCKVCNKAKPFNEMVIYKYKNRINYRFYCKKCRNEKAQEYKNLLRKKPEYKLKNDAYNKKSRINKLLKKYNIVENEYNLLLKQQSSCCAICYSNESKLTRSLSVDHDHKTGKVRGLLCTNCNTALGLLKEDIILYERSIHYIKLHK